MNPLEGDMRKSSADRDGNNCLPWGIVWLELYKSPETGKQDSNLDTNQIPKFRYWTQIDL